MDGLRVPKKMEIFKFMWKEKRDKGGFREWNDACALRRPGQRQPMYVCMYVAFETNPQDYRRLSSSTACGLFRRGNCACLPVSLFSANRCNNRASTSFGLRWVFFFFLSPFADAISLGYQLICFTAQSCTYVYIAWHDSIVPFFLLFPYPCACGHALYGFNV